MKRAGRSSSKAAEAALKARTQMAQLEATSIAPVPRSIVKVRCAGCGEKSWYQMGALRPYRCPKCGGHEAFKIRLGYEALEAMYAHHENKRDFDPSKVVVTVNGQTVEPMKVEDLNE